MSEERGVYRVNGPQGRLPIRPETRLEYANPKYETPTPDEVRAVLKAGALTGSAAGDLVGVSGRTVRKWTGGEQGISYAAWRLLLMYIGVVEPVRKDTENEAAGYRSPTLG